MEKDINFEINKRLKEKKYSLKGRIIKGRGEARALGFPTANLRPYDDHIINDMIEGVYSCQVRFNASNYKGMCYLDRENRKIIEVHIFNFNKDIYNQDLSIVFKHYIRKPVKSLSLESMKQLIHNDAFLCLQLLGT